MEWVHVPKAIVPDRDLPNFDGKQRDISKTMAQLAERARLGEFLAEHPEPVEPSHRRQHDLVSSWARVNHLASCGRCVLGDRVWDRYEAGVLQPVEVVDRDLETERDFLRELRDAPKDLPSLPIDGFIRASKMAKNDKQGTE